MVGGEEFVWVGSFSPLEHEGVFSLWDSKDIWSWDPESELNSLWHAFLNISINVLTTVRDGSGGEGIKACARVSAELWVYSVFDIERLMWGDDLGYQAIGALDNSEWVHLDLECEPVSFIITGKAVNNHLAIVHE